MEVPPIITCHVLAVPYPARGHINALMNLCKLLIAKNKEILVTYVVTEEWAGFIGSEPRPANIRLATIPNVIASELTRSADHLGFMEDVMTKMEAPLEQLLDRLEPPPTIIVYDTFLFWVVGVGNRRSIPVASFWTMAASVFSVLHHHHLLEQKGHYPVNLSEMGEYRVNYIPGVSPTRLADLPLNDGSKRTHRIMELSKKGIECVSKAQYILLSSMYELEPEAIDVLKAKLSLPIYNVGPTIPHYNLGQHKTTINTNHSYLNWLDHQPNNSVLYISQGSFFSVSSAQIEEIAFGLRESGVRFLWIARQEASRLKEICGGDKGLVLGWCDQWKVLNHPAIGGFWTHCGWNSTKEGVFGGVPFLTLPIIMDQGLDSKMIVEDWKVGWRVKEDVRIDSLVRKDEIVKLLNKFMDLENDQVRDMRKRVKEYQHSCQREIAHGRSFQDINSFVREITKIVMK
ncbi:UDP-glycosyltransferase 87A1-like [Senna tora]|uniref:UDP-glycosyltransferase 87A1-like n=1 Tax=Senna tora TaxID=362788 RepID=A0A834T6Q7_9FABA|nr:UDP-glycosyltransferase 87A1-like [Senna tora]